jgi:hypothetical protein
MLRPIGQSIESLVPENFKGTAQVMTQLPATLRVLVTKQLPVDIIQRLLTSPAATNLRTFGLGLYQELTLRQVCEKMTQLQRLYLWIHASSLQLMEIAYIRHLRQLEALDLTVMCSLSREDYSADFGRMFKECSGLRELRLLRIPLNDEFFEHIYRCSKLETLVLTEGKKPDDDEDQVALVLDDGLHDYVLDALAQLPELKTLRIVAKNWFTAGGLVILLSGCPKLSSIVIEKCESQMATNYAIGAMAAYATQKKRTLRVDISGPSGMFSNVFS